MEKKTQHCPMCSGIMDHDTREHDVTYEWASKTITSEGWWCRDCGEVLLDGEDSLVCFAAFEEVKRRVEAARVRSDQEKHAPPSP